MEITVKMTSDEFLEFNEFQQNKSTYQQKTKAVFGRLEFISRKICWAIGVDPKKEGKVKILDQEHAQELLEQAEDFLS